MRFCVLAVLLMTEIVGAAELSAIINGIGQFTGPNCRTAFSPSYYDVGATIQNPSSQKTVRVTYLYYNSSSGQFEDGSGVCYVMAGVRQVCTFRIYPVSGGRNGSDLIPLKIVGWVGEFCRENVYCAGAQEYDTVLNVTVNHYTSLYEENVLAKLAYASSSYKNVSMQYNGSCYDPAGFNILQDAYSEIQDASNNLTVCSLPHALNLTNEAINKISQAGGYPVPPSCTANQSAENNTQPPPPPPPKENNTTGNVTQNQTLNQTWNNTSSNENLMNVTSALIKGCIPFCVLAVLLVLAVWSERTPNA